MLTVRDANESDAHLVVKLATEAALCQDAADQVVISERDFRRHPGAAEPMFQAILAEWEGTPAGVAVFSQKNSTWNHRRGIYLDDLYVRAEFRRRGVGRALMIRLAQIARMKNCTRVQWKVLDWNRQAIAFYEALGAHLTADWLPMQVCGAALTALAESPVAESHAGTVEAGLHV